MTVRRSTQFWTSSSALLDKKSLSPLFPAGVGGGVGGGQWLQMTGALHLLNYGTRSQPTTCLQINTPLVCMSF